MGTDAYSVNVSLATVTGNARMVVKTLQRIQVTTKDLQTNISIIGHANPC
jgi:hypothetical protein